MNISIKQLLAAVGVFLLVLVAVVGAFTFREHQTNERIVRLQNEIALRDKTIEVQQGVYQKLAIQTNDLRSLLDSKDKELSELQALLKKSGDQLLTANTIIVKLRHDLESKGNGRVTKDPHGNMVKVDFDTGMDLEPFRVVGQTIADCSVTDPGPTTYGIRLSQIRPLKLNIIVSQTKDGAWRSSATSSEKNFQVDIALGAVNPAVIEEKWYEKLDLTAEVGVGTNPGLLAGGGVNVEIGKFDVGPRAWVVVDHGASPYFGASLSWHPFRKVR